VLFDLQIRQSEKEKKRENREPASPGRNTANHRDAIRVQP